MATRGPCLLLRAVELLMSAKTAVTSGICNHTPPAYRTVIRYALLNLYVDAQAGLLVQLRLNGRRDNFQ